MARGWFFSRPFRDGDTFLRIFQRDAGFRFPPPIDFLPMSATPLWPSTIFLLALKLPIWERDVSIRESRCVGWTWHWKCLLLKWRNVVPSFCQNQTAMEFFSEFVLIVELIFKLFLSFFLVLRFKIVHASKISSQFIFSSS